ncbi:hypothetical protein FVEN_g9483 [Fusarium venenatum]|uniref:uncharacterized protein n=1 Tax=Fusarium venenatum TaxID=56646 RepID=UPI001DD27798|nr:hypothetical protein FVEN_g9483 [Fusarium venenatum]KAH7002871.1 hypothetical protein EDB82DRAFT_518931 [Fusarium venenatum]
MGSHTWEDEQAFRAISFKWSTAWDMKDRDLFCSITTAEITVDYSDYPAVPLDRLTLTPDNFFAFAFKKTSLGDPNLQTQHLLGLGIYTYVNDAEAKGNYQVRARHVRRFSNGKDVEWDSSCYVEHVYTKVDGTWKLKGIRPHTVIATTGAPEDVVGVSS